ncbi:MAG TPA: hypothetical protein VG755_05305 [Nannocystaceae bacterium]|nr:hypothetical protein [Nannocystaceae bacterium]
MSELWHAVVAFVHVLGGGVWIGAVGFNVFVLHPRAEKFFAEPGRFEDFVFTVVSGMRWWVVAGIAMLAGAGVELLRLRALTLDAVLLAKLGLLATNVVLFTVLSWRMWPARVVAAAAELPSLRRRFARIGATMVACNILNAALGVWHHVAR